MDDHPQSRSSATVLIVDNYDSFTRNLTALVAECGAGFDLVKSDRVTDADVLAHRFVLLSPGPGVPSGAGRTCDLVRRFAPSRSILGVCLGHQAIAEVFGATLSRLAAPDHGVSRGVRLTGESTRIFRGLPREFDAGFYHSWEVAPAGVPACLAVTAVSDDGGVAALSHRQFDVHGVQFHPESVMTPQGRSIIANWLSAQSSPSIENSGSSGRRES